MKTILGVSALALLTLAACSKRPDTGTAASADAAATPAAVTAKTTSGPMTPPERKVGLWEHKMSTAGMTQVSRICFDEAVNKKMSLWGQQGGDAMCSQTSMSPTLGGWKFASTCNMGSGGTVVSTGEAKGDFGTHYVVDIKSTTTGAGAPQMNGEHAMTLEATWKGACPADFKPGDMELPGGMKINMLTMGEGLGAGGGKPSSEQIAAMRKQMMAAAKNAQH